MLMLMTSFQLFKFCFMSLITDGKSHNMMAKVSTRVPIRRGCSDLIHWTRVLFIPIFGAVGIPFVS